ncbi:MAG: helix-turn-helix transcriptional regulator [Patescibacteria group bacterium]
MNKKIKARDFQKYLAQQLKNPEFKRHYDDYGKQLEIAYQILKLRKQRNMSQLQLARKIKTKQSNIARIEAGKQNLSIQTLDSIARALNSNFTVNFS